MSLEIEYDSQPLQKQQDEATEKGLKLLHKTKNRCYGYYELPCGHFSFLHYGSVRKSNSFKCNVCQEQLVKERVSGTGLEFVSKFEGSLEIPRRRWCDYGYYKYTVITTLDIISGEKALQIEKQIHRDFRSHRLNPDEMKRYHTCSGFTECYPTSILNKLVKRLEETKINE